MASPQEDKKLDDERASNRLKIERFEDKLASLRLEKERLKDEQASLHLEIERLDDELASNRLKIERFEDKLASLRLEKERLKDEQASLHLEIERLDDELASNRLKIERLEDELASIREKERVEDELASLWEEERERDLKEQLDTLMRFHYRIHLELISKKPQKEILAEAERKVQRDLEKFKVLIAAVGGKCLLYPCQSSECEEFLLFFFVYIRDEKMRKICVDILKTIINEGNAQQSFLYICECFISTGPPAQPWRSKLDLNVNYLALYNVIKHCISKGAVPSQDNIKCVLTLKTFSTSEALLSTLQLVEQLIEAYRNCGITKTIAIYLNPMQNLYNIDEDLRLTAGRVIRAAYCTLRNCLKSRSVVNTVLFLGSGKDDIDNLAIMEGLETADRLQQKDVNEFSSMDWLEKIEKDVKEFSSMVWLEEIKEERHNRITQKYLHRNDNCFQRSLLHLLAIFVHDTQILDHIPDGFIKERKDGKDLHGCTPLHIAYLHGNKSFISLLESCHANVAPDHFGRTPKSIADPYRYKEGDYREYCRRIVTTNSSVFDTMKEILVLPVEECQAIKENFQQLFGRIVAKDGILNARVRIAGSVREKLKVGRFNEVDLQICMDKEPFAWKSFQTVRFHEHLVKRLAEVKWDHISLRPVSVAIPWKFIWERKGCFYGLVISVDIVPIFNYCAGWMMPTEMPKFIINNAPAHQHLQLLKHTDFTERTIVDTVCDQEWDIIDNLPPGCRLGIFIAKALVEVLDQASDTDHGFLKHPITSYMIKNTVFWILAGKTPKYFDMEHGKVMRERYGHLQQQLDFKGTIPTWTTEEDLERYGEEGRLWAETIFDAINFMARNYHKQLGSFLKNDHTVLLYSGNYDTSETCERCLELLRPSVFFKKEK